MGGGRNGVTGGTEGGGGGLENDLSGERRGCHTRGNEEHKSGNLSDGDHGFETGSGPAGQGKRAWFSVRMFRISQIFIDRLPLI